MKGNISCSEMFKKDVLQPHSEKHLFYTKIKHLHFISIRPAKLSIAYSTFFKQQGKYNNIGLSQSTKKFETMQNISHMVYSLEQFS